MINIVHLIDCMEFMKTCKDKEFDLACVDPPYFEDYGKENYPGAAISTIGIKRNRFESKFWEVPNNDYFKELCRISQNQIIWGINYFNFTNLKSGRIVWDKVNDSSSFSKCEIAYCSLINSVQIYRYMWNGMLQGNMKHKEKRCHSCQKPIALYKWILKNYAKPEQTIFDSHVGSGSSRIACHDMGFEFTGCEIDPDYFNAQEERYQNHIANKDIFDKEEMQDLIFQGELK